MLPTSCHTVIGIPSHIEELAGMWTFAPDNRITEHPIRFGTNDAQWTAVMGYLDATFTKFLKLPNGGVIAPTGKNITYDWRPWAVGARQSSEIDVSGWSAS